MKIFLVLTIGVILLQLYPTCGQQIKFNRVVGNDINDSSNAIITITQDQQGFIWFSMRAKGFMRYDGSEFKTYSYDLDNPNSLGSNSVKDISIPQKIIGKIFQPFFTTKPTSEGTGLGLSMSYDIIKVHGGAIEVETFEGEGSDFIILIPMNQ
jgi:nitrogen-specific signal transduction histidine kinase